MLFFAPLARLGCPILHNAARAASSSQADTVFVSSYRFPALKIPCNKSSFYHLSWNKWVNAHPENVLKANKGSKPERSNTKLQCACHDKSQPSLFGLYWTHAFYKKANEIRLEKVSYEIASCWTNQSKKPNACSWSPDRKTASTFNEITQNSQNPFSATQ